MSRDVSRASGSRVSRLSRSRPTGGEMHSIFQRTKLQNIRPDSPMAYRARPGFSHVELSYFRQSLDGRPFVFAAMGAQIVYSVLDRLIAGRCASLCGSGSCVEDVLSRLREVLCHELCLHLNWLCVTERKTEMSPIWDEHPKMKWGGGCFICSDAGAGNTSDMPDIPYLSAPRPCRRCEIRKKVSRVGGARL